MFKHYFNNIAFNYHWKTRMQSCHCKNWRWHVFLHQFDLDSAQQSFNFANNKILWKIRNGFQLFKSYFSVKTKFSTKLILLVMDFVRNAIQTVTACCLNCHEETTRPVSFKVDSGWLFKLFIFRVKSQKELRYW